MKSSKILLFSVLLLGWMAAESLAAPPKKQKDNKRQQGKGLEQEDETGQEKSEGKAKQSAASYLLWGDNNMANVQDKMNAHFAKKKKDGDAIEKYGDKSRTENEALQQKTEDSQDKALQAGMQWTDKEVQDAESNLLKDGKGKGEGKESNNDDQGEGEEEAGEDGGEEGEEDGKTGQSGRGMKGKGKKSDQNARGLKAKGVRVGMV